MPVAKMAAMRKLIPLFALAVTLNACGGGSGSSKANGTGGGATALSAEAQAAATGDIPDSQVFLTFRDADAGYSIVYPEGWAQSGTGNDVRFQDKNNLVHITVRKAPPPSTASVTTELQSQRGKLPSLQLGAPTTLTIKGAPVVKISYSTLSPPNPVTGKQVQLIVDRYAYARSGKVATIDLGTAKGVDNVDAYKRMAQSFTWK